MHDLDQAEQIDPNTTSFSTRGRIWLVKKDYKKAIDNYLKSFEEQSKKVMRSGGRLFLTPDQQSLIPIDCEQLAWIYSSCPDDKFRDGKKALEWARKSIEYSGARSYWRLHEALAAAYAETGDFDLALAEQKNAYDMLLKVKMPKTGEPDIEAIKKAVERIKLYREKKPYRLAAGENLK